MQFTCKHKNEPKRNVCLCSFWKGFGDRLYLAVFAHISPLFHLHVPTTVIPSPLLEKPRKLTLHWWQQLPWAHSAPSFRVQLLALQQGLLHSWKTARCNSLQGRCSRQEYCQSIEVRGWEDELYSVSAFLPQQAHETQHLLVYTIA